jgi:tetratricopeptide (TPR) repeat protein
MYLAIPILAALLFGQVSDVAGVPGALAEARDLQTNGKLDKARDIYERVLLLRPQDSEAQDGMSLTSEQLALNERAAGHMDIAFNILVRAQRAEPDNPRVLLDLGILEDEIMLYREAAGTLEHLETLGAVDPNTYYALARTDLHLGRLEPAEEQMKRYLKVRPDDASAHYGLGKIYLQGVQFSKAEAEFRRSIEIQPKQSESYYELGQALLDRNEFEASMAQYQKTLERDPRHGGALAGMGIAYFKLKQYEEARKWLVKATLASPDYQPGHYYLGLTLRRLGDASASRRELDVATELAAKDNKEAATRITILNPEAQP